MRNYIGLACTCHDPAISIVDSKGNICFSEDSERYLQNKRGWNSIPDDIGRISKLIDEYCEKGADIIVANSWSKKMWRRTLFLYKFLFSLIKYRVPRDEYEYYLNLMTGIVSNLDHVGSNLRLRYHEKYPDKQVIFKGYEHHLTHAATSCYTSPFKEAVCVVVDASGEFYSTGFFHYQNGKLKQIKEFKNSLASIGLFYSHLCYACGFDPIAGEEWKIMGLAPYGKFNEEIYQKLKNILYIKKGKIIPQGSLFRMFVELRKMRRKADEPILNSADLAYNGQLFFSEMMTNILTDVYRLGISDNLILSGGCGLNSAYNGKILETTAFKNLFIFSAPGDDGNAIGSALLAYYEDNPPKESRAKYQTPYLGSSMSSKTIENMRKFSNLKSSLPQGMTVIKRTAELLSQGKIIGWVQGRAEFGPRALGNRSILADPRSLEVKDILNSRVKFREEYRPFAPSILHEFGHEYFENYQESPYMERTLKFKEEVKNRVPGVVHADGTGRLQTIKREWNERYYELIHEFYQITGIPILLNTSFNIMGKPIIHSVEDALAGFLTTGLDVLVIGDNLYEKDILIK
ncbi:MAG: hypothetical protein HQK76_05455 [Desulfobacterales bacterium]|nr:hypothetical protein [Desulfobacterales bacterium]